MNDNELIIEKSWFRKNRTGLIIAILLSILLLIILLSSNSQNGLSDTFTAFKEDSLYNKAIDLANKNSKALQAVGKIAPIDKLAILEGSASYTNSNNSVDLSIRINGDKKNGKLEIHADRKGSSWDYKKILIRLKNPNQEIVVIDK